MSIKTIKYLFGTLLKDLGEDRPNIRMHIDASAAKGIIERRGLSKLRHIELDILWLQEQEARKLLPIEKVLGTDNVSDLMTKYLTAPIIERYLSMLSLHFAEGRSAIAQNLHSIVGQIVGSQPTKSGSQSVTAVETTTYNKPEASDMFHTTPSVERIAHHDTGESERKGHDNRDSWSASGEEGRWCREHKQPRRSLFTPMRVSQGPRKDAQLLKIRQTRGVRLDTLESFTVADDWTQSTNAHRVMPFSWVGSTTFQIVSEFMLEMHGKGQPSIDASRLIGSISSVVRANTGGESGVDGDRLDAPPSAETCAIKKTHDFDKNHSHCSPRGLFIRNLGFCAVDDCVWQHVEPTAVPDVLLSHPMIPAVAEQGTVVAAVAKGTYTFEDGSVYAGDLMSGKPHGVGEIKYVENNTPFSHYPPFSVTPMLNSLSGKIADQSRSQSSTNRSNR